MSLPEQITADIKKAMLAREKEKLEALGKINFSSQSNKPKYAYSKIGKVTLERLTTNLEKLKR